MKSRLSYFVKWLFLRAGVYWLFRKLNPNRSIAILRYHAIVDPEDNWYASPGICITSRNFERQVRYFSRKYNVISLDDAVQALNGERDLPPNALVITFDDGYADNYEAYKVLKKYDVTGTIYITVACIDGETFWLSEVYYLLKSANAPRAVLEVRGELHDLSLISPEARVRSIRETVRLVKSNNVDIRSHILSQLRKQLAPACPAPMPPGLMLNWAQVKEMHREGMCIGGHTMTHANLPNAGLDVAGQEISGSKKVLEEKLRTPIRHFSYPNSGPYEYYNEDIRRLVVNAGYESAATSRNGFAAGDSDLFALQRIRVTERLPEIIHQLEFERVLG